MHTTNLGLHQFSLVIITIIIAQGKGRFHPDAFKFTDYPAIRIHCSLSHWRRGQGIVCKHTNTSK